MIKLTLACQSACDVSRPSRRSKALSPSLNVHCTFLALSSVKASPSKLCPGQFHSHMEHNFSGSLSSTEPSLLQCYCLEIRTRELFTIFWLCREMVSVWKLGGTINQAGVKGGKSKRSKYHRSLFLFPFSPRLRFSRLRRSSLVVR